MANPDKILHNIVLFCRTLRQRGLAVTTGQVLAAVDAARHVSLAKREDVKAALRAILVNRKEDLDTFNESFDAFWSSSAGKAELELGKLLQRTTWIRQSALLDSILADSDAGRTEEGPEQEPHPGRKLFSSLERLRRQDFARLTTKEMELVKTLMSRFSWSPPLRRTRRKIATRRGAHLDLRRMFRASLKYQGWPLELMWRSRKKRYRPLVLICDVSGSMESYSRILLQFCYVLSRGWQHVEVFLFSTRLTRITHQLRHKNIDLALARAVSVASDWGGGTRIGEALRDFNYRWSRRVLGGGPIVIIVSDGWDRGDADRLAAEMDRLRRSCHTLIWLNPLLGTPGYQPLTRGIQAALPRTDFFLPVHNLVSLERLAGLLQEISGVAQHRLRPRGKMWQMPRSEQGSRLPVGLSRRAARGHSR